MVSSKVHIYGLVDPRDRRIKYVGQTVNMSYRLSQHIKEQGSTPKCKWCLTSRKLHKVKS